MNMRLTTGLGILLVSAIVLAGLTAAASGQDHATEPATQPIEEPYVCIFPAFPPPPPVVFVVDCTGSTMGAFGQVRDQVLRSIGRLVAEQEFHVVYYGSGIVESEPKRLVNASDDYKIRAAEFLSNMQPEGTSDGIEALERAFEVLSSSPQKGDKLVLFYTDGGFADGQKVVEAIRRLNAKKDVTVSTVQIGKRYPDAQKVLKAIAQENGGRYRLVAPYDDAMTTLVREAISKKAHTAAFRGGQRPTGLDLDAMLALGRQNEALANFPEDHREYAEAIAALAKDGKAGALGALLDYGDVDVKIRAARALLELAQPETVPVLLAAAKANNYWVSGSESATLHSTYRRTLKDALEKITAMELTPKGLKVTEHPQPGVARVITSDDNPGMFREEVDFAKVEAWLREKYLPPAQTQPATSPAAQTQPA